MDHTRKHKKDAELLQEKIKGIRVAMLTTQELDGSLHSRPMLTPEHEFDGDLWFFTLAGAPKVYEVQQNQQVCLSYARTDETLFVSVSGSAQLVRDQKKIKELWKPAYKTWFPDGPEDPNLALLKVRVERAEYWDWPAGKGGLLYSIFKAGQQESGGVDVKLNLQ